MAALAADLPASKQDLLEADVAGSPQSTQQGFGFAAPASPSQGGAEKGRAVGARGPAVIFGEELAKHGLGAFLVKTVAQEESCTSLDLAENDIGDDGAAVFKEVLSGCPHLCRLNLARTGIRCGGFGSMGEFAQSSPALETLVLAGNAIGHIPATFYKGVQLAPALRALDLSACGLTAEMLRPLSDALCARPQEAMLERLNVSYNHIELAGLGHISRLLGEGMGLRTLEISACHLGPKGGEILSQRISKAGAACSLRRLRADRNGLQMQGCRPLVKLWNGDQLHLDFLDLQENGLTEAGTRELSDLLGKAHGATVNFQTGGGRQVLLSSRVPQGRVVRKTWNGMEAGNVYWDS